MDKWFKDILPDKDPYHNRGRDQMRKKGGSGIRVPVVETRDELKYSKKWLMYEFLRFQVAAFLKIIVIFFRSDLYYEHCQKVIPFMRKSIRFSEINAGTL